MKFGSEEYENAVGRAEKLVGWQHHEYHHTAADCKHTCNYARALLAAHAEVERLLLGAPGIIERGEITAEQMGIYQSKVSECDQLRAEVATLTQLVAEKDRVLLDLAEHEREVNWRACCEGRSHGNVFEIKARNAAALTPESARARAEAVDNLVEASKEALRVMALELCDCIQKDEAENARSGLAESLGAMPALERTK